MKYVVYYDVGVKNNKSRINEYTELAVKTLHENMGGDDKFYSFFGGVDNVLLLVTKNVETDNTTIRVECLPGEG